MLTVLFVMLTLDGAMHYTINSAQLTALVCTLYETSQPQPKVNLLQHSVSQFSVPVKGFYV